MQKEHNATALTYLLLVLGREEKSCLSLTQILASIEHSMSWREAFDTLPSANNKDRRVFLSVSNTLHSKLRLEATGAEKYSTMILKNIIH